MDKEEDKDLTAAYLAGYHDGADKAQKQIAELMRQLEQAENNENILWHENIKLKKELLKFED